jgi:hypothetical protein
MTDLLDKSMNKLFKVVEDIQQAKDSASLSIKGIARKINPIVKYFNNYKRVYNKTDASEHVSDIQAMFKRNRIAILRGDDDTWLKDRSVNLQYGDGLKETQDVKIMLSSFYNSALQVKKLIEEQLEGLPQEAYEDKVELLYPDVFKLHLYRIISEAVSDEKDKATLKAIVKIIEKDLGIESESTPDTTPNFSLGNLISEATKLAKSQGVVGDNIKLPNENELTNMIGKLFNSPQLKETFGSILGDLQNVKSPDQLFGKIGESVKKLTPQLQELTTNLAPKTEETKQPETQSLPETQPEQTIDLVKL